MIGPVAMLVAGMLLASLPLRSIVWTPRLYLVAFLRLILIPVLLLFAVKACGFAHHDAHADTVVLISFLATTSPAASTVTQMADCLRQKCPKSQRDLRADNLALCGNHAGDDCVISLDYLRKGQAV